MEFGPCSVRDLYDYLRSDLAHKRGLHVGAEINLDNLRNSLEKLIERDQRIIKFQCKSGTKIRYGFTKYVSILPTEPRFLKVKGRLDRCFRCGQLKFTSESKIFHLPAACPFYKAQNYFKILKINDARVIISENFVYGVIDNLNTPQIRFPGVIFDKTVNDRISELWYINNIAHQQEIIIPDRLLPLKVDERLLK